MKRYDLNQIAVGLVNLMVSVVGALLGIRFILKLFGANSENQFVNWIYQTSGEVLGPFRNVFPSQNLDGFVIEFSTIFAMMVYAIIGMLAFYVIDLLTPTKGKK